jgi:hypothetical protein
MNAAEMAERKGPMLILGVSGLGGDVLSVVGEHQQFPISPVEMVEVMGHQDRHCGCRSSPQRRDDVPFGVDIPAGRADVEPPPVNQGEHRRPMTRRAGRHAARGALRATLRHRRAALGIQAEGDIVHPVKVGVELGAEARRIRLVSDAPGEEIRLDLSADGLVGRRLPIGEPSTQHRRGRPRSPRSRSRWSPRRVARPGRPGGPAPGAGSALPPQTVSGRAGVQPRRRPPRPTPGASDPARSPAPA